MVLALVKNLLLKTLSEIGAQTAGKTLLLGWNKNGELIQKKHSSAFRLLSPVLDAWAPRYFTDPKIQNKRFRYLVYPSTITDLTSRKGIFSKNIQDKLRQSDLISASILSNQTLRGYTVGVILEVPEQNILAADPDANAIEANLKGAIKKSGRRAVFNRNQRGEETPSDYEYHRRAISPDKKHPIFLS